MAAPGGQSRPSDASAHLGLARAYQVTGDLDSARKEYKTVVKIDTNHPNLPAARQSFKLALAKREAKRSFDFAHSFEIQGQLAAAYQKASDAVELYPSEVSYQAYKVRLAGELQSAGMPVYAASGQAMQTLCNLMANGEQPPSASLPTAQAMGLNAGMAGNNMQGAGAAAAASPAESMAVDNMYKPLSTDAHITSMTGFLASLRNFTMQQKAAQSGGDSGGGLSSLGGASSMGAAVGDASSLIGLSGVPGFAPSNPLPGSGLPTSLDSGQLIAQGSQAQQALAAATASGAYATGSPGKVTAASALQAAAAALANTAGGSLGFGGSSGAGGLSAGSAAAGGIGLGGATAGLGAGTGGGLGGAGGGISGMGAAINGGAASGFLGGLSAGMGGPSGTTLGASSAAAAAVPPATAAATAANLGVSNSMAAMALGLAPSAAPTMASTMIGGLGQAASYLAKNRQATATGNIAQQNPGQLNYGFTPNGNFATAQTMPTTVTQRVINSPGGNLAMAQSLAPSAEPSNVTWPQPQPLPDSGEGALSQAAAMLPATATGGINPSLSASAAAAAAASDPTSQATALALAPPIVPTGQFNPANLAAGGGNLTSTNVPNMGMANAAALRSLIQPGALKLYLTGVTASKSEVELHVSLRNDSSVPLKIPGGIKAVVRSSGQPDKQAKVSFTSKVVNSGSTIVGTIKVPGKNLDPTADVIIPTSDLTRGAIADIHLSVPISAR